jgi:uncharacterized protein (TIGR00375 family)
MCIEEIARYAKVKGLNVIGTGDFTHPKWFEELNRKLIWDPDTSLYKPAVDSASTVHFMPTTEVNTTFPYQSEIKKIHHVILTPTLDTARQINDKLSKYGNLHADGRPTLNTDPPALVEEIMETSSQNMIFPAHAWTPWFSIFGAFSGFNSIEECYGDMTKHIHALETGLSSDPPMNWRLSKLDKFTLVSNSDSHSFWPWRIGREANVFELTKPNYREITQAIQSKDSQRFKYTIETDPSYGKYHWTGHRNCNVSLSARDATKLANICPVCRRRLTKGVEQRVEELADRPEDFQPKNAIGFMHLLPLSEIISAIYESNSPSTSKIWAVYNALIEKFGNEYTVLISASKDELVATASDEIAKMIVKVREGKAKVMPGYDGVYGQLVVSQERPAAKAASGRVQQLSLADFTL